MSLRILFIFTLTLLVVLSVSGENDPKPVKKKYPETDSETKTKIKIRKGDGEDTLIFDKSLDDTLIFADDESIRREENRKPGSDLAGGSKMHKSEKTPDAEASLFPNPCNGSAQLILTHASKSGSVITLTNLHGVVVKEVHTLETHYLLSDLPAGTYIVHIHSALGHIQKKLFVK